MLTMDRETSTTDCPPPDAEPANGRVFRCAKSNPPVARDMLTHHETGRVPAADPCLRQALSVFTDLQDAQHQARLFPGWRRRCVLFADLEPAHGKVKPTKGQQPSHTSWWPAPGLSAEQRAAHFRFSCEVRS